MPTITGAPSATDVLAYLGSDSSWDEDAVTQSLASEQADQLTRVRLPLDNAGNPIYPPALVEALCRRVAHNLAVRALPLGVQASITDGAVATNQVGGLDAEVRRLEAPWRRLVVG